MNCVNRMVCGSAVYLIQLFQSDQFFFSILRATPTAHLSHLVNSRCTIFTVQHKSAVRQQRKSTDHLSQLGCSIKYSVRPQLLVYHTWWIPGVQSSQSSINPPFSSKENQLTIYHSWGAVYNTQCNPNCLFITLGIFYGRSVVYNNSVQLQTATPNACLSVQRKSTI